MLAQKLILSFSSKVFNKILQLVGTIIVARFAGPDVLGTVAFGLAYVSVFGFLSELGTGTAHIKLISDGEDKGNCNSTYLTIRMILIGGFVIIVGSYYLINKYLLGHEFETDIQERVVLLSLLAIIFTQLISIAVTFFNSNIQQAKQDVPEIIKTFLNQGLRITVVLLGYGAIAIVVSNIFALLLVTPLYLYLLRKFAFGRFDKKLAKKYLAISIPLIVVTAVNSLVAFGDKLILENFSNTEEVGYYVAGYRLSGVVLMMAGSLGIILFPTFTKLIKNNDYSSLNSHIQKFEGFSYSFVLPLVLALALFSKPIVLFLLGSQYENSTDVLSLITISLFTYTMIVPYGNVITANGRFDRQAQLAVVKGLIFATSSYVLLSQGVFAKPSLGMAFAVLITYLVHGLLVVIFAKRLSKQLRLFGKKKIPIFGILYSLACWWLLDYLQIENDYLQMVSILAYLFGYWALGGLLGIIGKNELKSLYEITKVRKLLGYVRSELRK